MGKPCFSTIIKFLAIALLTAATAITAIAALSSPAAARTGGRVNLGALKSWDTDNLSRWVSSNVGQVGAKNYRIPYHNYKGYFDTTPAKPCIQYIAGGSVLAQSRYDGSCPSGSSLLTRWCSYGYVDVSTNAIRYTKIERPYSTSGSWHDACPSRSGYPYRQLRTSGNVPQLCVSSGGILSLSRNCPTRAEVSQLKHAGCQSAVADAFFQTGGDTGAVNDFPVASYGSESEAGSVAGTESRDRGCVEFAEQQDRLQASVAATGHYLALEGDELVLKANSGTDILDTRITAVRSAGVYGRWDQKGTGYEFAQQWTNTTTGGVYAVAPADGYRDRVDTRTALAVGQGLSSGLVHPWSTATVLGSMNRSLACSGGQIAKYVKRTPTYYGWGGAYDTSRLDWREFTAAEMLPFPRVNR